MNKNPTIDKKSKPNLDILSSENTINISVSKQSTIVSQALVQEVLKQNLESKHAIILSELMVQALAKQGFCKKSTLLTKRNPHIKLEYKTFFLKFKFSKDVTKKLLVELQAAGFIKKSKAWDNTWHIVLTPKLIDLCMDHKGIRTGNIVFRSWYKEITNKWGQPDFNCIMILAEVVYLSRVFEKEEEGGKKLFSKTKYNRPQISYKYLETKFNLSRQQVHSCLIKLETLNFIKRLFSHITPKGTQKKLPNRMFIEINKKKIPNNKMKFKTENYFFGTEKILTQKVSYEIHTPPLSSTKELLLKSEVQTQNPLKYQRKEYNISRYKNSSTNFCLLDFLESVDTNYNLINKLSGFRNFSINFIKKIIRKLSKKVSRTFSNLESFLKYLGTCLKHEKQTEFKGKGFLDMMDTLNKHFQKIISSLNKSFSFEFVKQLIQNKLAKKYPNHTFLSNNHFIKYMEKILKNEKRTEEQIMKENYKIKETVELEIDFRKKEKFLNEIENSRQIGQIARFKRRIAAVLSTDSSYEVLTSSNIDRAFIEKDSFIIPINPNHTISLSSHETQILLDNINSILMNPVQNIIFKHTKSKSSSTNDYENISRSSNSFYDQDYLQDYHIKDEYFNDDTYIDDIDDCVPSF